MARGGAGPHLPRGARYSNKQRGKKAMIISTKRGTPAAELDKIIREFEAKGLSVTMIRGTDFNVFCLVGDTTVLDE